MSDEKIITHQDVIDGLHEEIAALKLQVQIERKHAYGDGHLGASIELHSVIQERDTEIAALKAELDAEKRCWSLAVGRIAELEWEYASVVNQFHDELKHNTKLDAEIAALKESRKVEMKAYDELQNAFINLNLELDACRERIAELEKVAEAAVALVCPAGIPQEELSMVLRVCGRPLLEALRAAGYLKEKGDE